jgi:iron complex outermembrane receptor protein
MAGASDSIRGQAREFALKIEPQPLDEALQAFARQSGIQIAFFSNLTEGLRAPAIEGQYTLDAAMGRLLAGSRLTFRLINAQTIEIQALPELTRNGQRPDSPTPARWPAGICMASRATSSSESTAGSDADQNFSLHGRRSSS